MHAGYAASGVVDRSKLHCSPSILRSLMANSRWPRISGCRLAFRGPLLQDLTSVNLIHRSFCSRSWWWSSRRYSTVDRERPSEPLVFSCISIPCSTRFPFLADVNMQCKSFVPGRQFAPTTDLPLSSFKCNALLVYTAGMTAFRTQSGDCQVCRKRRGWRKSRGKPRSLGIAQVKSFERK